MDEWLRQRYEELRGIQERLEDLQKLLVPYNRPAIVKLLELRNDVERMTQAAKDEYVNF